MAKIFPFHPYRYSEAAGPLVSIVTQPYDKISPAMRANYLRQSPYNLVRIILGESTPADTPANNVYTRAAGYLRDWIESGVLQREAEPSLYAYFQEFRVPDSGELLMRKGFIGLGAVEEYSAGVVHRHEQTLSGPKKDRLELLRHTHTHFGQLFMLYPDPRGEVDALLDEAAKDEPVAQVSDEYGAAHRLWKISDASLVARIQQLMADKKLLIADGHHRYETALAFSKENPGLAGADKVMMTFVNMYSPGLKILATHRVVSNLEGFDASAFFKRAEAAFTVERLDSSLDLSERWEKAAPGQCIIGAAIDGSVYALTAKDSGGKLDVPVLHEAVLGGLLGISEEAVREGRHLRYIRGLDAAITEVEGGAAQIAFLLKATSVQQVADISFGGGVMPQKSTDFYPKLLSGLTIYKQG